MLAEQHIDRVIKQTVTSLKRANPNLPKDYWQDMYQEAWVAVMAGKDLARSEAYLRSVITKRMRGWIKKLSDPLSTPERQLKEKSFELPTVVDFKNLSAHHTLDLPVDDQVIMRHALQRVREDYREVLVAVLFGGYSPWEFATERGMDASEGDTLYEEAKEALKEELE